MLIKAKNATSKVKSSFEFPLKTDPAELFWSLKVPTNEELKKLVYMNVSALERENEFLSF